MLGILLIFQATINLSDIVSAEERDDYVFSWYQTWHGTGSELAWQSCAYNDSIYVMGYTDSYGEGDDDILLLKYDTKGTLQWYKIFGGVNRDEGRDVIGYDGYIYVTGSYNSTLILLKYDQNGNLIWNKTWDDLYGRGWGIYGSDNHIYICGYHDYDAVIVKYDTDGNMIWNRSLESTVDRLYQLTVYDDFLYLIGTVDNATSFYKDLYITKFDVEGNMIWNASWGGESYEYGMDLVGYNGSIYLTGETASYGSGDTQMVLLKYDTEGNFIWERLWGGTGSEEGRGIAEFNGMIYISVQSNSFTEGNGLDVTLLKYDIDGNIIWSRTWGGPRNDYAKGLSVCNGDMYIQGDTDSFGDGRKAYLVKFERDADCDGYVDSNDSHPDDPTQWTDTDSDGYGDNQTGNKPDHMPTIWGNSTLDFLGCPDYDGDGWSNLTDAFPEDHTQWNDTDGDGFGDNHTGNNPDAFKNDSTQWQDTDGDGYGDNKTGNNPDDFINDPSQWLDSDGDGYGDNQTGADPDLFPDNPDEWSDMDLDGIGDNSDVFPKDPSEWKDSDKDGIGDNSDFAPTIANAYIFLSIILIIVSITLLGFVLWRKRKIKNN
jgi:hypothetical protein